MILELQRITAKGVIVVSYEKTGKSRPPCVFVCVVTDGLDSEKQAERTAVTALLLEPGPHVGARGDSPLPDLHVFLEAQSYIGMIANVRLISLSSSAG